MIKKDYTIEQLHFILHNTLNFCLEKLLKDTDLNKQFLLEAINLRQKFGEGYLLIDLEEFKLNNLQFDFTKINSYWLNSDLLKKISATTHYDLYFYKLSQEKPEVNYEIISICGYINTNLDHVTCDVVTKKVFNPYRLL